MTRRRSIVGGSDDAASRAAVEAVWRVESPRIVAALVRMVRDVGLGEDLAQEAFVVALEQWPRTGVPDNPGAWLVSTARNRAIDQLRRHRALDERTQLLGHEAAQRQDVDDVGGVDLDALVLEQDFAGDDLLRLLFAACHPVLAVEARVALTLRLFGGLTTSEIARALLAAEPTVAQRIVRARRRLAADDAALDVPSGTERNERLASVCEVVYLIFNEGYAATSGAGWTRPDLCREALRLGRSLVALAPGEGEVLGLSALMDLQASRLEARRGPGNEIVLLPDQDRRRWDQLLVRRGLASLDDGLRAAGDLPGPYLLQAAIAACHARAARYEDTDWARIAAIYAELAELVTSPVVELNRAVAVSMADGPAAALDLVDRLVDAPALASYHLLPSVRGDLLRRLGREPEARLEFARAAAMTTNEPERELLQRRAEGAD